MSYQFKLEIFEGPLDLLLHLIREQKMDIYDIPIAQVTRQYMDYLELMRDLNLEVAGEYLVMAAELTKIKSRLLLPVQETPDEEEQLAEGEDPRAELTRRLLEYQRYREAAFELRKREYEQQQVFTRTSTFKPPEADEEEGLVEASVFDLLNAFQRVLKNKSFKKEYEVKITALSVSDRISDILEILNVSESVTFESLFTVLNSKQEVIVTFLAILELMRLELIRTHQVRHFDTLRIYRAADQATQEEILQQYHQEPDPQGSGAD